MLAAAEHFTSVYKTILPHGDTVISSSGFVWSDTVPKAWNLRSLERVRGKASAHVYNCIIHLLIDLQTCAATAHLVYKVVQSIGKVLLRQDLEVLLQVLSNQVLNLALVQRLRPDAFSQASIL